MTKEDNPTKSSELSNKDLDKVAGGSRQSHDTGALPEQDPEEPLHHTDPEKTLHHTNVVALETTKNFVSKK